MPRNPTDYRRWKVAVNVEVGRLCGLSTYDLPDYDFATAFDFGDDPKSTAREVLEAADCPAELLA